MTKPKITKENFRVAARKSFENIMRDMEDVGLDPLSAPKEMGDLMAVLHKCFKKLGECKP